MSKSCCSVPADIRPAADPRYRRVLWVALFVNAAMFAIEIAASLRAGSSALLADAVDFGGDASNYALSLGALATGVLAWRLRAALLKGWAMTLYGIGVLGAASWSAWTGVTPEPVTMGSIGVLALAANVGIAVLLFRYRTGDADMRSVWLCTRNDALGNVAVLAAALGVFGTGAGWPDQAVAVFMATLALSAGASTIRQARREMGEARDAGQERGQEHRHGHRARQA